MISESGLQCFLPSITGVNEPLVDVAHHVFPHTKCVTPRVYYICWLLLLPSGRCLLDYVTLLPHVSYSAQFGYSSLQGQYYKVSIFSYRCPAKNSSCVILLHSVAFMMVYVLMNISCYQCKCWLSLS